MAEIRAEALYRDVQRLDGLIPDIVREKAACSRFQADATILDCIAIFATGNATATASEAAGKLPAPDGGQCLASMRPAIPEGSGDSRLSHNRT